MNLWRFVFFFLLIMPFVNAAEVFSEQNAQICLNQSDFYLDDLFQKGFNVLRINDTLNKADLIYLGQSEKQKKSLTELDFSLVQGYCEEIEDIYYLAIESKDDYFVMRSFYDLSYENGMNNNRSLEIMNEVDKEINNERYEKVSPLVDEGYQEISEMVKNHSTLNRFYKNATLGIFAFFQDKWKEVVITMWSVFILFLIFRLPVKRWKIKQKIKYLKVRKLALEEYFKKVQKEYFDSGKISQRDYLVRGGNYSNFVLEIDREVAVLNEELERIGDKNKKEKEK